MSKILFIATRFAITIGISVLQFTPCLATGTTPVHETFSYENISKQVLTERINNIKGDFDFRYSSQVHNYIKAYTNNYRIGSERLLGRVTIYFPIFENAIRAKGLPQELKYLSIIESNLNPNARSKAGAVGLWQFMYRTAQIYDLEMNKTVDERRDPYKSTEAALSYLEYLYDQFDDWTLAIAAYNCGPGNLRKAIRRAKSMDFWKLRPFLPKETQNYVPKFIAVSYFMNYYHAHNLEIAPVSPNLKNTETAKVFDEMTFEEISSYTGINLDIIKQLNPSFLRNYIPEANGKYLLTLPNNSMQELLKEEKDMVLLKEYINVLINNNDNTFEVIASDNHTVTESKNDDFAAANNTILSFKVEDDINLDVSDNDSPIPFDDTESKYELKAVIEQKSIKKPRYEYYRLNKKETLYDIVMKRRDISLDEILKINTFSLDDPPQPGTIIKVKKL